MGVNTTNYGFQKPTVGGDDDVWGSDYTAGDPTVDPSPGLNGNWEKLDQIFKALEDRVAATEAVALSARVPVGGIYMSNIDATPAITLGYGTWVAYAEGRAMIGVGNSGTGLAGDWTAGQTGGVETQQISVAELPSHEHSIPALNGSATANGGHAHSMSFNRGTYDNSGSGFALDIGVGTVDQTEAVADHTHAVTTNPSTAGSTGSGEFQNNLQPLVAVYCWIRTA